MRRALAFAVTILALVVPGCRRHREIAPDRPPEPGIPRKVATEELAKLLPTADSIYCSNPSETMKPAGITSWNFTDTAMELSDGDDTYTLAYADITNIRLDQAKKYFYAKVFTKDPKREHFHFRWTDKRPAEQAVELFLALRPSQP